MNLFRPTLLFWVCILALLGAATAGAQTLPFEASFSVTPAEPIAGEPITFTDTTNNPTNAKLTYAWDLDADDTFDDGTTPTVSTTLPAGEHRIALRVRRLGTVEVTDTEVKTITVEAPGEPTPTPTPTPTATPTATPTPKPVIKAPKINLPPTAALASQCGGKGPAEICLGPLVQLDKPKTFDATPSKDPDGTIVRYQWDVDGNGTFEHDTGAEPRLTTTLTDEAPATLKLRVTDDEGGIGETTTKLVKLEPQCQSWVRFARVHASSQCLRRYSLDNGGAQYRSRFPVSVNGITIAPMNGKQVLINLVGSGLLRRYEIIAGKAEAQFPFKDQRIAFQRGPLRWTFKNNQIHNAASLNGHKLNGLEISGAPDHIDLPSRGVARTSVFLKLPKAFGGPTSEKPLTLTAGSAKASGDAFSFTVPSASIGPIPLTGLTVSYDGDGLWEIAAGVQVPVLDASIEGKAGIYNGSFNYAGAEVKFGSPGLGPFGPVYLQRIKFRIEINPRKSECVPLIGKQTVTIAAMQYTYDYGVPTFALCGEVGLTGGPSVLGAKAVSLDAGLGLATYDDRPSVLRAFGDMEVAGIPFANATFEAHTDGFLKVGGRFRYGWDGFASIHGYLDVGILGKKFNAEGGVKGCLDFVDFCRGVKALISSKGIAVCMIIDYGIDDWRPGFGYKWGDALPDPYFAGCSLGPYRETIRRTAKAAAVSEHTVALPGGLPGTVVAAQGAGAPPKITLQGPNGERITTPDDLMPVESKPFFLMKNPNANLTQIAVAHPAGGQWKVIVEDGSAPVTSLKVAHAMTAPKITAKVAGRRPAQYLDYEVEQREGQTVTFVERGASTQGEIGVAGRAKGELAFTPAGGAREKREIVAVVEQDGLVAHQIVVAHYRAPGPTKPAQVRNLRTLRVKKGLKVTWKPSWGGARHIVTASLSDGRRFVRNVEGRSVVIKRVDRRTRALVAVRAVSDDGVIGKRVRVRAR